MNIYEKIKCAECGKEIERIDAFSGDRCLDCYEAAYNTMTQEEKKPNFVNTINI